MLTNQQKSNHASSASSEQGSSNQNSTDHVLKGINGPTPNFSLETTNAGIVNSGIKKNTKNSGFGKLLEKTLEVINRDQKMEVLIESDEDDCQIVKHDGDCVFLGVHQKDTEKTASQKNIETSGKNDKVAEINEEPRSSNRLKEKAGASANLQEEKNSKKRKNEEKKNKKTNHGSLKKSKKSTVDTPSTSQQYNDRTVWDGIVYNFRDTPETKYRDFSGTQLKLIPFSKVVTGPNDIITLDDDEEEIVSDEVPNFVTGQEMGHLTRWMEDRPYKLPQRSKFLIHRLFMGTLYNVKNMGVADFYLCCEIAIRRAISDGGDGLEETIMNIGIHHPKFENGVVYFDNVKFGCVCGDKLMGKINQVKSWKTKEMFDENLRIQVDVVYMNRRNIVFGEDNKYTLIKALPIAVEFQKLSNSKYDSLEVQTFNELVNNANGQFLLSRKYNGRCRDDNKFLKQVAVEENSRIVLVSEKTTKIYNEKGKKVIRLVKIGSHYDVIIPIQFEFLR